MVRHTLCAVLLASAIATVVAKPEAVFLDGQGVVRWHGDGSEVALFGANYCLPSASDFRAAGHVQADRRQLIERDMAHFARMGWTGLRLALWGDWENSDKEGNLIENEHLALMDYLLFQAKQRGISMLFTPIHTHSSLWPDGVDGPHIQGFSKHFPRDQIGRDPAAIAAQANYLRQILEHVNPYTGVALKDEPSILFIELINEPWHHADDFDGSVAYINALVDAVRSTGCEKILFHNLSQDFAMAPAIGASRAQGVSFGWYPTGLLARRTLNDSFLRWVDDYPPMTDPRIQGMPRIVYEFDAADTLSPALYPAMVRTFRTVGTQFAAMFAYDMLDTAPYNLGWQTHFLNLVYTPRKAVGAIIAAEAMRRLPRGAGYGSYPENKTFGDFGVASDEGGRAWLAAPDALLYAGDFTGRLPDPDGIARIVGVGSSAMVRYEGSGAYFLDRVEPGIWRLEVYPDVVLVQDPFAQSQNRKEVSARLLWRMWPMHVNLPDLGADFSVEPVNAGNSHRARVSAGSFPVAPGVYLLSRDGVARPAVLPDRIGQVGFAEFDCPGPLELAPQIVSHVRGEYPAQQSMPWEVEVASTGLPSRVELHLRGTDDTAWTTQAMERVAGNRYRAFVERAAGRLAWFVTAEADGIRTRYPKNKDDTHAARIVEPGTPCVLFLPARDDARLFRERRENARDAWPLSLRAADGGPAALRFTDSARPMRVGLSVRDAIVDRKDALTALTALRLRASAPRSGGRLTLVLIEEDGTSWSAPVDLNATVEEHVVPLDALQPGGGSKMPVGYPGSWNTHLPPAAGRGGPADRIRIRNVQHLQIVFEPVEAGGVIEVEAIALTGQQ